MSAGAEVCLGAPLREHKNPWDAFDRLTAISALHFLPAGLGTIAWFEDGRDTPRPA